MTTETMTTTQVFVSFHGVFSWQEDVVRQWQEYERGRAPHAVPLKLETAMLEEYVLFQERIGCSPLVFPMNRWLDLFRPFTQIVDGLEAGPLTRFAETNTFFRAPVQTAPLRLRENLIHEWLETYTPWPRKGAPAKYVLPSPYFFAAVLISSESLARRLSTLGDPIIDLIDALKDRHKDTPFVVQFQDPYVAASGFDDPSAFATLASILRQISRTQGVPVILHTYFGGSPELVERALQLPLSGLGVDASYFPPDSLSRIRWNPEVNLYLGIQDVRTTRHFDDLLLRDYIARTIEQWKPPELTLSFNGDPEFLPYDVFSRKAEQLARLKRMFE